MTATADRQLTPVDLADPELYAHGIPHEVFAQIRAMPGLAWNPLSDGDGFWAVTRHSDVVEVSRDTTTYSSAKGHIQIYDIDEDALDARASMIDMDPPRHTRLRRLVSAAFTPNMCSTMPMPSGPACATASLRSPPTAVATGCLGSPSPFRCR
ncbi:MAG: hypothetical protein R2770_03720 [Acidimicrobiales bacterium]